MRLATSLLTSAAFWMFAASGLCQEKAAPAKPAETKPAEAAKPAEATAAAAAPESPNPTPERNVTFTVDTGYRFVSGPGGDFNTYRSVVNLGEGPKLFGVETSITDPKHRLFDRLNASAHNWGGDPYNTLRVDIERTGIYRFLGDYRNIQYFNFLPSFANPGAPQTLISERAYDAARRYSNIELELMPGRTIVPYFIWTRDQGYGRGITPYVANSNEYPVSTLLDDRTNLFRAGVRIERRCWHLTLEQGGGTYGDDQRIVNSRQTFGNVRTPIFNQRLYLTDLLQSYGVTGRNLFTKGILTTSPVSWANFYASFIYSRPSSDVTYTDRGTGLFLLGAGRFFNTFQTLLSSEAKLPRNSGSFGGEFRLGRRIRVLEALWLDRFHNAGSALLAEQFLTGSTPLDASQLYTLQRTVVNYNRQQVDAFFDILPRVTLRGGHRYVFGDAVTPPSLLNGVPGSGEIRQQVGLAGINVRATSKVTANLDYEGSPGDRSYFRTSLHNYHQVRARVRSEIRPNLHFSSNFYFLDNQNPNTRPAPALTNFADYSLRNYALTGALQWQPGGGKYASILTEYTRSSLKSDIRYLVPQTLTPERSYYRDDGHMLTGLLDLHPRGAAPHSPHFSVGGSLFRSGGSRPTNYYQPIGRVSLPVNRMVELYGEWRWYGMTESVFLYEGFRAHIGIIGLRLMR